MRFWGWLKSPDGLKTIEYIFVLLTVAAFLFYKLSALNYRYSDHNIYFFYADRILKGDLPFRDFFMTDPAFYAYILAAIRSITKNALFLQTLPLFLYAGNAILLYVILKKWAVRLAVLAPSIYLFAFSSLANSDYATGEEWMILFMLLAIFFWERNKPIRSGIFWAVACLSKLYAAAGLLVFMLYAFINGKRRELGRLIAGGLPVGLAWFGIFSAISFNSFWYSLIGFHLKRAEGIEKLNIYAYFFRHEWLLIALGFMGLVMLRKKYISWVALGFLIFTLFFKDLYYLYLQVLVILLAAGTVYVLDWIWKRSRIYATAALVIYLAFIIVSISFYDQNWKARGVFANAAQVSERVKALPENYPLYGSYETAPLVSLLSGRGLYKNYYDTNPISFQAGRLDKEKISTEAVNDGVYMIARITHAPEYGIIETGYEGYFDPNMFKQYCSAQLAYPSTSRDFDNYLVVYKCKK